jgi:hypothetical protein
VGVGDVQGRDRAGIVGVRAAKLDVVMVGHGGSHNTGVTTSTVPGRAYAGVGSRATPAGICHLMERFGAELARRGWTLRSGGAVGADSAFEKGAREAGGRCEIYLPWPGYNEHSEARLVEASPEAYDVMTRIHPVFARLPRSSRRLHARNAHQILGADLRSPVEMVVCWTPGGRGRGGTGSAIRLARSREIPVHDLADIAARRRMGELLGLEVESPLDTGAGDGQLPLPL